MEADPSSPAVDNKQADDDDETFHAKVTRILKDLSLDGPGSRAAEVFGGKKDGPLPESNNPGVKKPPQKPPI